MGSLFFIILIIIIMGMFITGWSMLIRYQKERKISEFKISYLKQATEEQSLYHRYIQAEKNLQNLEMENQKSKETTALLKQKVIARRKELREMLEELRLTKSKVALIVDSGRRLDAELDMMRLREDLKTKLVLNNEDKKKILHEMRRLEGKADTLPTLRKEVEEHSARWEAMQRQVEALENEFRALDAEAFRRFTDTFHKRDKEKGKVDPERELINLILLLQNKQGLLYVRKKEAAKDPTTESMQQINKYTQDIQKLQSQITRQATRMNIPQERVAELKSMFQK